MSADLDVSGTPYYIAANNGGAALQRAIRELSERVEALRAAGALSPAALRAYFGEKRVEQIAESNALEGSPLTVGETELAVLKGITISGHDPAYSRDAQSLGRALDRLVELARDPGATDLTQLKTLHGLILGERPGAGIFRSQEVRISGSSHLPPRDLRAILDQMERWEGWSTSNALSPPLLRSVVLHAWLTHIHPFIDGNGRAARAVGNLELIRAGYPAVILRRKDRVQYLDALAQADGGDLGPMIDLVAARLEDALRDLERAAARKDGYDATLARARTVHAQRLELWNARIELLRVQLGQRLEELLGPGNATIRGLGALELDDFIELCDGQPVRNSWIFRLSCRAPAMPALELLLWAGYADAPLRQARAGHAGLPALMWSEPNPEGYPPWRRLEQGPGGDQFTLRGDAWLCANAAEIHELSSSELADRIARDLARRLTPQPTL